MYGATVQLDEAEVDDPDGMGDAAVAVGAGDGATEKEDAM